MRPMMLRPTNARHWFIETAAALVLGLPAVFITMPLHAANSFVDPVYPRAGVSSDAYRTPPELLSPAEARPLLVQHRAQSPVSVVSARQTRQPIRDPHVVPIDHEQVQTVGRSENRHSVQAELQRLYAEEGREMPQMAVPRIHQPPATSSYAPAGGAQAAPPVQTHQPERRTGLLAGLFDFGRSRNSRSNSSRITQPPAEPQPFRPPTYRQRPMPQQPQAQTPAARTPAPQSTARQPSAQSKSSSVIELKRVAPERNAATQDTEFFPADDSRQPQILSQEQPATPINESADELAEFFPADSGRSPAVASAADTAKQKMQQLFRDKSHATAEDLQADDSGADEQPASDGFQAPVLTAEPVIPQPAPAAVSEMVTTNIAPPAAAGPEEPAPFFADEERAIDPQEKLEIAEVTGQTFDPSGADSQATAGVVADADNAGSRMQQIAAREGVGLKGYCPVALRDGRRLADGKAAFVSYYRGKAYYFSSAEAKDTFDAAPADYAPASAGEDVIMKTLTGEVVDGSLDHSVWYRGRLYLFHSAENLKTFMAAPSAMAVTE